MDNTPYFIELENEYYIHKDILNTWHKENNYGDIHNSTPYPKESLYRMLDLLDIMDNMFYFAPDSEGYIQTYNHFYELAQKNS